MCGVKQAIAVSSGTAALSVALLAHGIGPGDEVITTSFSFVATANSILATGARPVFADILPDDFNIDPADVARRITNKTKAMMPVHLYGHPARMDELMSIAETYGLAVIEDACQSHGATINNQAMGSFGTGCFSFYATKNVTTGEGGMITTNDDTVANAARLIRNHGATAPYHHEDIGYNWRLTDILAALGTVQLKKLGIFNDARRKNAAYLSANLRDVETPTEREGCHHVYHQYTVRVGNGQRDALLSYLREQGIGANVYYPTCIHQQPIYRKMGYREPLPEAEKASLEALSLPVHPALTNEDLASIVDAVSSFAGQRV
jgi:dTDP-4-amino-4,6-dideoxygalactose transaminase